MTTERTMGEGTALSWEREADDLDREEVPAEPVPRRGIAAAAALLLMFPALARLVGGCEWMTGPRAAVPGAVPALAITGAVYFAALFLGLVWPAAEVVLPALERAGFRSRVAAVAAFLSLPLLSFGYYLGAFRDPADYLEIPVAVLPGAIMAALVLVRSGRQLAAGLLLAGTSFVAFFVVGDLLGPFRVFASYASNGPVFYFLRALVPPLAVALAVWGYWRREWAGARLEHFRRALGWLLFGTAFLQLLPALLLSRSQGTPLVWGPWDLLWLGFPLTALLLSGRSRRAYLALGAVAVLEAVLQATAAGRIFAQGEVSLAALAGLTQCALALSFYAGLLATLGQPAARVRFPA